MRQRTHSANVLLKQQKFGVQIVGWALPVFNIPSFQQGEFENKTTTKKPWKFARFRCVLLAKKKKKGSENPRQKESSVVPSKFCTRIISWWLRDGVESPSLNPTFWVKALHFGKNYFGLWLQAVKLQIFSRVLNLGLWDFFAFEKCSGPRILFYRAPPLFCPRTPTALRR